MRRLLFVVLLLSSRLFGQTIPSSYIGLEMKATGGTYPTINFGSARLWDSDVAWTTLNPSNGVYAFGNVDGILGQLYNGGVLDDVIYTVGMTPNWASSNPSDTHCDGFGASGIRGGCWLPSDLATNGTGTDATFIAFIQHLATHLNAGGYLSSHAHVKYWSTWNEWYRNPVVDSSFTNCATVTECSVHATYAQMVRMTEDMRCVITGTGSVNGVPCTRTPIDSSAIIITPSSGAQSAGRIATMENFLRCDHSPIAGSKCTTGHQGFDAVSFLDFHMYEDASSPANPQLVNSQTTLIRSIVASADITAKPLISSEGGWGLNTSEPDLGNQVSFIARYYALGWSNGFTRLIWYEYENSGWGTLCNGPISCTVNSAGIAYNTTYTWLAGATPVNSPFCNIVGTVNTCAMIRANGRPAELVWDSKFGPGGSFGAPYANCSSSPNPSVCGNTTYTVPGTYGADWRDYTDGTHAFTATVTIGAVPILLEGGLVTTSATGPSVFGIAVQ